MGLYEMKQKNARITLAVIIFLILVYVAVIVAHRHINTAQEKEGGGPPSIQLVNYGKMEALLGESQYVTVNQEVSKFLIKNQKCQSSSSNISNTQIASDGSVTFDISCGAMKYQAVVIPTNSSVTLEFPKDNYSITEQTIVTWGSYDN